MPDVIVEKIREVFPADAGMIPKRSLLRRGRKGVPRGCGDDPKPSFVMDSFTLCSPRMRG